MCQAAEARSLLHGLQTNYTRELTSLERRILHLRYLEHCTQSLIAARVGIFGHRCELFSRRGTGRPSQPARQLGVTNANYLLGVMCVHLGVTTIGTCPRRTNEDTSCSHRSMVC